jgi:hypothetical protein
VARGHRRGSRRRRFTLSVLTCTVVETASTTVVPDQSKLDPAVLQLPPFEGRERDAGDRRADRPHRIFCTSTLRYVGETFGGDVGLPPADNHAPRAKPRGGRRVRVATDSTSCRS